MPLPLLALGLAALEVPFALESGRNILEDVGFDPTGRVGRAKNASLGAALGGVGDSLQGVQTDLTEQALAKILEGSGGDPWAGMSPDAEMITRPHRQQLAAMSSRAPNNSLTSLIARAGLL